jgi:hypothetical protein
MTDKSRVLSDQEYYQKNKGWISEKTRQYRQVHKERIATYKKQYYLEHKELEAERNKTYYQENKEKMLARSRKYYAEHRDDTDYNKTKHKAKTRGIVFTLSRKKFKEIRNSPCTFAEVDGEHCANKNNKDSKLRVGVDRLTNGAYEDIDVIPMCWYHNNMKHNITPNIVEVLYNIYIERGILEVI